MEIEQEYCFVDIVWARGITRSGCFSLEGAQLFAAAAIARAGVLSVHIRKGTWGDYRKQPKRGEYGQDEPEQQGENR